MTPSKQDKELSSKKRKSYPGINIQWPISELILSGEKTIETRTYPIPQKYLNQEMVLIETPGPKGKFKARTRAIIKFTDCFLYKSKREFYADSERHRVSKNSPWAWTDKPKWGWSILLVSKIESRHILNKGFLFTSSIKIWDK